MTEEQTTNVTDGNAAPAVTPVPAVTTPTPPPSGQQTTSSKPNSDVVDADGKKWKDKFYGREGAIGQLQKEKAELEGMFKTRLDSAQQQLDERDASILVLQTQVGDLQPQIEAIGDLQEQIDNLSKEAGLATKYKILTEYPTLLGMQVEEEIPAEGEGEPTKVLVNPLVNLVENSTLEGDALRAEIARLATLYSSVPQQETPPPAAPVAPTPAEPVQDSPQFHYNKAMEIKDRMNSGEGGLMDEFREAWEQYNKSNAAATG